MHFLAASSETPCVALNLFPGGWAILGRCIRTPSDHPRTPKLFIRNKRMNRTICRVMSSGDLVGQAAIISHKHSIDYDIKSRGKLCFSKTQDDLHQIFPKWIGMREHVLRYDVKQVIKADKWNTKL